MIGRSRRQPCERPEAPLGGPLDGTRCGYAAAELGGLESPAAQGHHLRQAGRAGGNLRARRVHARGRAARPRSLPGVGLESARGETSPRRHQTFHFRKRATSAPAEGPAYGLDFARHGEFPLRALQAQRWHVCGSRTFGAA